MGKTVTRLVVDIVKTEYVTGYCLACVENRSGKLCENELPAKSENKVLYKE